MLVDLTYQEFNILKQDIIILLWNQLFNNNLLSNLVQNNLYLIIIFQYQELLKKPM